MFSKRVNRCLHSLPPNTIMGVVIPGYGAHGVMIGVLPGAIENVRSALAAEFNTDELAWIELVPAETPQSFWALDVLPPVRPIDPFIDETLETYVRAFWDDPCVPDALHAWRRAIGRVPKLEDLYDAALTFSPLEKLGIPFDQVMRMQQHFFLGWLWTSRRIVKHFGRGGLAPELNAALANL